MKCPKCGYTLPSNAKYCTSCGAYFSKSTKSYYESHKISKQPETQNGIFVKWRSMSRDCKIISVLSFLFGFAAVFATGLLFFNNIHL